VSFPFAAVLFDLDGTLIDSLTDIGIAMNRALEELGHASHPLEAYREFVGAGVRVLAERALRGSAEPQRVEAAVAAFRRHYADHLLDHTRPYPGVVELLSALRAQRVSLAVLSNKYEQATTALVDALFTGVFAEVRGHVDGAPRKPDPTVALAIAARLGVDPARCAFVGDTAIDMQTARNAGMRAIGVRWGFRDDVELLTAGAHSLLNEPAELLAAR
jgi:phosphoglycolate phosphatase